MSNGEDVRGPWNEGKSPHMGETWEYISDPIVHVKKTKGLTDEKITGTIRTQKDVDKTNKEMSKLKSEEVKKKFPTGKCSGVNINY